MKKWHKVRFIHRAKEGERADYDSKPSGMLWQYCLAKGLDTGDSDKAKKLVAHTRRSREIHMLAVSQQDLGDDIDSSLIYFLNK